MGVAAVRESVCKVTFKIFALQVTIAHFRVWLSSKFSHSFATIRQVDKNRVFARVSPVSPRYAVRVTI